MGHYASEMMCDRCGHLRCTCQPRKEKPNLNFIVTNDFRVVTVKEFDEDPANNSRTIKMGHMTTSMPVNPLLSRMGKKEFKRRRDAEVHARELCEAEVERARGDLLALKNILKVQRPWEKK